MEQLSEKMKEIAGLWKEIYTKNLKYFEKEATSTSYNIMSKIMLDWSEINKKQRILINEGIREYFRYIKNEFHSIKDLSLKVDNNKAIYAKYGFTDFIKTAPDYYPDGTTIDVEYYGKNIKI